MAIFTILTATVTVIEIMDAPILMNLVALRRERGSCGRHGAALDWPEEKVKFSGS